MCLGTGTACQQALPVQHFHTVTSNNLVNNMAATRCHWRPRSPLNKSICTLHKILCGYINIATLIATVLCIYSQKIHFSSPLRVFLKVLNVVEARIAAGRLFHSRGALLVKALSPKAHWIAVIVWVATRTEGPPGTEVSSRVVPCK